MNTTQALWSDYKYRMKCRILANVIRHKQELGVDCCKEIAALNEPAWKSGEFMWARTSSGELKVRMEVRPVDDHYVAIAVTRLYSDWRQPEPSREDFIQKDGAPARFPTIYAASVAAMHYANECRRTQAYRTEKYAEELSKQHPGQVFYFS